MTSTSSKNFATVGCNAATLANALNGLANNHRLADRLARRAFADASLYSWDARAARLEPVLVEAGGRS